MGIRDKVMNKEGKVKSRQNTSALYTKEELYHADRYRHCRDLTEAMLEKGKQYSFEEADRIIGDFLKGEVN